MKYGELRASVTRALRDHLDEREAASVARILREDLFTGPTDQELSKADSDRLKSVLQRLQQGEPVQYVVGSCLFYGHRFQVDPSVLIPRPETEELVWFLQNQFKGNPSKWLKIIDIGTGSGCIAISLALGLPAASVSACDVSSNALDVARRNAAALEATVDFRQVDFLDPSDRKSLPGPWDLIVSNPPYISREESGLMPQSVLDHEPHIALFTDGTDPLVFYRAIADFGRDHLAPGGTIAVEINEYRAADTLSLFELAYSSVEIMEDLQGKPRILMARN